MINMSLILYKIYIKIECFYLLKYIRMKSP